MAPGAVRTPRPRTLELVDEGLSPSSNGPVQNHTQTYLSLEGPQTIVIMYPQARRFFLTNFVRGSLFDSRNHTGAIKNTAATDGSDASSREGEGRRVSSPADLRGVSIATLAHS